LARITLGAAAPAAWQYCWQSAAPHPLLSSFAAERRGRRQATGGHSMSRFFRRLPPFPFAGLPVVAGDAALDHFVAPAVASDDESGQVATAEAKPAERRHDDELQQLTHCSSSGARYSPQCGAPRRA
jgi:hypothetical protein